MIGAWLLAQWGFPQAQINAVAHSHYATDAGEVGHTNEFERTVMLSGILADMWLTPDWEDLFQQVRTQAGSLLGLFERDVGCVIGMAGPDTEEVSALFNIALMGPHESRQLLDAAAGLLRQRPTTTGESTP